MNRSAARLPTWFLSLLTAVGAPTLEGCVTCEETSGRASFRDTLGPDTALLPNGALRFEGRNYDSCAAFCRDTRAFVEVQRCDMQLGRNQELVVECEGVGATCDDPLSFGHGRYTAGQRPAHAPRDVASYLYTMWHGERAAVASFERLGRELAAHHAPVALIARCAAACADERRHERMFRALLRRHGVADPRTDTSDAYGAALPVRCQEEMVLENLREGCFSEALGAWVLRVQASRAPDPALAACFRAVAEDEAAHAELSLAIARTFSPHADPAQVAMLRQMLEAPPNYPFATLSMDARTQLGAPSADEYAAMVRLFKTHVLAPLLAAPHERDRAIGVASVACAASPEVHA
jgi:rubrerythrin